MDTLSIIDTFGYFFRSFYAVPKLKSRDGFPTGVLMGFANLINQLYNDNSKYLVFALEGEGDKVRKAISSEYKANRPEADPELVAQIEVAIGWIDKMKLSNIAINGYEADDVIATLSKIADSATLCIRIVSSDKDLYQLIGGNTYIYDPLKKKEIRTQECYEKFGVFPMQFVDYQSLVGDSSDNVSGIKGIGAKSAQKLIEYFGSLDMMYERSDEIEKVLTPRLATKIIQEKESAIRSRELVRLRNDLFQTFNLESMLKPTQNPLFLIADELERYDIKILSKLTPQKTIQIKDRVLFTSSMERDSTQGDSAILPFESICVQDSATLLHIIDKIPQNAMIAFDTETDSLDTKSANIVGFSFAFDKQKSYYVPLQHNYLGVESQISLEEAKIALERLLKWRIIGHNLKFDIAVIRHNFGIEIEDYCDTMILAWLYDSSQMLGLDFQMKQRFAYTTIKFDDIVPKGRDFASVNLDIATKYAAEDSLCVLYLYEFFSNSLDSSQLKIANEVEFPFIKTLIQMENNGIGVDVEFFVALQTELSQKIAILSDEIYKLADCVFNINSTRQLGDVLFGKLGLKKGKALKNSGFSTNEKTLEMLQDSHPIVPLLLEYRELNKLLNTYVVPMIKLHHNSRIYTSFLHTGTSTGRLSSRNPNLQNIPVKTEIGRKIRYGFIAQDGYRLVSADYSQIELRLLAHFSQDSALVEAFKNDKDIHLETAKKIFGEANAESKRNIAKSINFGLIYGMGVNKLSSTLKIPQAEAKSYIQSYFESFPSVRGFLSAKEGEIVRCGYSSTLLGRRRIFDFSNIQNYEKLAFLREGVNAIFQGSAADLIKLSMNECFRRFDNDTIKLLIQVHDELIFEVKEDIAESFCVEIAGIMNNIYQLNVPLKCGVNIGTRWLELK